MTTEFFKLTPDYAPLTVITAFYGVTTDRYNELVIEWMRAEDAVMKAAIKGEPIPSNPGLTEFLLRKCGKL